MKIFIAITATLILSALAGLFYRMGGAAKTGKWYDFLINTKARDFGVPLCIVLDMIALGQLNPALILTFGSEFGVQTTYWKKKGTDAHWYNWLLTGFFYGIGMLPLVLAQQIWPHFCTPAIHTHWIGFGIRTVVVTGGVVLITSTVGNAVKSEFLRGLIEVITLPLLLIG